MRNIMNSFSIFYFENTVFQNIFYILDLDQTFVWIWIYPHQPMWNTFTMETERGIRHLWQDMQNTAKLTLSNSNHVLLQITWEMNLCLDKFTTLCSGSLSYPSTGCGPLSPWTEPVLTVVLMSRTKLKCISASGSPTFLQGRNVSLPQLLHKSCAGAYNHWLQMMSPEVICR